MTYADQFRPESYRLMVSGEKAGKRTDDPDFLPSLRLLVCREEYALEDIGMMFGVSRERVRQWCVKYRIEPPSEGRGRGLFAVRVWDDEANRFRPVPRKVLRATGTEQRKASRRSAFNRIREARRERIVAQIRSLALEIGRSPTQAEMASVVWGRVITGGAGPLLAAKWGLERVGGISRNDAYTRAMIQIQERTGIALRSVGNPGHLTPKGKWVTCRRGHTLAGNRNRWGQCISCRSIYDERRHARNKAARQLAHATVELTSQSQGT